MDLAAEIERIYNQLSDDRVDMAVMSCVRIARYRGDLMNAARFLRELEPNYRECIRALYDDTRRLDKEARRYLWEKSLEQWIETHSLEVDLGQDEDGEEKNILSISVLEIDPELSEWQGAIDDLTVPTGMGEYDTAAFADQYLRQKAQIRLRIKALTTIKQRVKTLTWHCALSVEWQLQVEIDSRTFLDEVHMDVNNCFQIHSPSVFKKLEKATKLISSDDPEDLHSLQLHVRRALKSAADYFYPAVEGPVTCADGKERTLGNDQYLNRLHEFVRVSFTTSSSVDLLRIELDYLAAFVRRINDTSSKGVHDEATLEEAKQCLLGLYFFLYNVSNKLSRRRSEDS